MIRAKFKHSRKGIVFQRDEEITNLSHEQEEEAVGNGLAYYDIEEAFEATKPTDSNTVTEIKGYLNEQDVEFDASMNKAELLELC